MKQKGYKSNVYIMKFLLIFSIIILPIAGCQQEKPENRVNIRQLNDDGSNKYRVIFEERLKEYKEKKYYNTEKKDAFK